MQQPPDWERARFGLPDPWPVIGGDADLQAIEVGTAVVARRWKPAILKLLAERAHRYNLLHRRLPGITAKVLTQQLRELEADGLVEHEAEASGAKVSTYRLTAMGEALRPVITVFLEWCRAYAEFRRYRAERAGAARPSPAPGGPVAPARAPRRGVEPPRGQVAWQASAPTEAPDRRGRNG